MAHHSFKALFDEDRTAHAGRVVADTHSYALTHDLHTPDYRFEPHSLQSARTTTGRQQHDSQRMP